MQQANSAKEVGPDMVLTLWTYRRRILALTILGAVGGLVASYVVKPLYKSEVVMYPAVSNSVSRSLLLEQSTGRDDIMAFGDEQDAEQLMQMLQSDRVRDRVADKFDLWGVYGIDPESKTRRSELIDAYEEHISYERTNLGSVRIEVLDRDPKRAADIANHIAELVDVVWGEMVRERAAKGVTAIEHKLMDLERVIQMTDDSLRALRELGVHDYYSQSERYNEYIGAAIVKGDQRAVRELEDRFKMLAEYAGPYVRLHDQLNYDMRRATILRMKLEQATADMDSEVPHKFVVNYAQPSDNKYWPKRWLFLAISAASAFLIALCSIVVEANLSKIRDRNGK